MLKLKNKFGAKIESIEGRKAFNKISDQISRREMTQLLAAMDITMSQSESKRRSLLNIGVDEIRIEELEALMYKDGFNGVPFAGYTVDEEIKRPERVERPFRF